tara:strand:+ start:205 stop:453 length:249 start_codon:yes stop_codon:yes gene_type:complete
MNKFWPARSKPKGFSAKKSSKLLENKLIDLPKSSVNSSVKKHLEIQSLDLTHINLETKSLASQSKKIEHWANRQYDEYRSAA